MIERLKHCISTAFHSVVKLRVTVPQYLYLKYHVIPNLRREGEIASPYKITRGHAAYLILTDTRFIKVSLSSSTLEMEYANKDILVRTYGHLADMVPEYRYIQMLGFTALATDRLIPLNHEEAAAPAVNMFRRLRYAHKMDVRLELKDCPQISAGLNIIQDIYSKKVSNIFRIKVEKFLADDNYIVGVAHGDYHSRNIMKSENGTLKLIDLDCLRCKGISDFDALYFILEQHWSRTRALWLETLIDSFAMNGRNIEASLEQFSLVWTPGLGLSFFLDRIGQDYRNYRIEYSRKHLDNFIKVYMSKPDT